jgi:uncharacterized protein DUF2786
VTTTDSDASPTSAMLRRVQLLLAKASDSAATPEESETYMAKATELMARYGIEQAMLDADKPKGEREQVTNKRVVIPGPYAMDKRSLLHRIAKVFNVKDIRLQGLKPMPGALVVQLFGFPSELAQVELMFASLTLQAIRDVMRERVPSWDNTAAFRRTFLVGFADVVGERLVKTYGKVEREATAATPGTALVLVDRRQQVEQAFTLAFPRTVQGQRRLSGSGVNAGRAAGQRADIGGNKVGGGRVALGR